jgi:hypothetical protein
MPDMTVFVLQLLSASSNALSSIACLGIPLGKGAGSIWGLPPGHTCSTLGREVQFYFGLTMFPWTVKEKKSGFEDQEQDDIDGS